jgi:hypothetical protein
MSMLKFLIILLKNNVMFETNFMESLACIHWLHFNNTIMRNNKKIIYR